MSVKARMLTTCVAGILVGLTGCGSSDTPSDSAAPSATATTSDTPPTTSAPSSSTAAPTTSAPQAAAPVVITIKDFKYTVPASVAPGAKVTVKNEDSQNHTVTSTPAGAFDANVTGGGGTATFTAPKKAGSYPIICTFHANMSATLVVK